MFLWFCKCCENLEVLHFPSTMDGCDVYLFIVYGLLVFLFDFFYVFHMCFGSTMFLDCERD
jgi:hypothetical protein